MRLENNQNKELPEIKTSWDKDLVNQLMGELPINHKEIKTIMHNDHGTLNRKIIREKYGKLLGYSDFFGLPVWALMTEESAHEVMPHVKDEIDKNIPPFCISDLEEILNYISDQTGTLTLSKNDRKHVALMVDKLKKILKRHERWSDTWRVLFSVNQDKLQKHNDYDFTCNLLFTYNSEIIYRGTLRFYKRALTVSTKPLKLKDSILTSWFFIKKMIPSANKPKLILSIVDDISTEIFTCQQPHISMNTDNDEAMLFSWNSNFQKNVITIPSLTSNFRNRMRELNSLSMDKVFLLNEHFYSNEPEDTRSVENNKSSGRQISTSASRSQNILDYLLMKGYIKDSDYIVFKNGEDYEYAEITIPYKRPKLFWRGDIYSFRTLTNKLLREQEIENTPNSYGEYWYLPGRKYSLNELANFLKTIHKS